MRLLLFSDLHSDFRTASKLVELSKDVDIVVGAGDFCIGRRGLESIINALSSIKKPTVLDLSSAGRRLGSRAVRTAIEDKQPALVVCGHIHGSSGQTDRLGDITVINAGPQGIIHNIG